MTVKYELIHGGKPDKETELDKLWIGLRDRIDAITTKQPIRNPLKDNEKQEITD